MQESRGDLAEPLGVVWGYDGPRLVDDIIAHLAKFELNLGLVIAWAKLLGRRIDPEWGGPFGPVQAARFIHDRA